MPRKRRSLQHHPNENFDVIGASMVLEQLEYAMTIYLSYNKSHPNKVPYVPTSKIFFQAFVYRLHPDPVLDHCARHFQKLFDGETAYYDFDVQILWLRSELSKRVIRMGISTTILNHPIRQTIFKTNNYLQTQGIPKTPNINSTWIRLTPQCNMPTIRTLPWDALQHLLTNLLTRNPTNTRHQNGPRLQAISIDMIQPRTNLLSAFHFHFAHSKIAIIPTWMNQGWKIRSSQPLRMTVIPNKETCHHVQFGTQHRI